MNDIWFALILSMLSAFGMAVVLVEKGDQWPVSLVAKPLRRFLAWAIPSAEGVMNCAVCLSFWTALFNDLIIANVLNTMYFWPFSGFATLGLTWVVYELLGAIDSRKEEGL